MLIQIKNIMNKNLLLILFSIGMYIQSNHIFSQTTTSRYPHEDLSNWEKWGKEDQKGAGNYITPELIVKAAKLIKKGQTFSLAIPINKKGPLYPAFQYPQHDMRMTGVDYSSVDHTPYMGGMKFAHDAIDMSLHATTSWDGLSHAWYGDSLYNGYSEKEIVTSLWGGARKLGIENMKESFVGRGILIDVLNYKNDSIPKGYLITRADIENTLKKQRTEVKRGDMVLIRTGVVPSWYKNTDTESRSQFGQLQTGIDKDVVLWIKESEITAMAADNMALERLPNPHEPEIVSPLHGNIIRDLGVYIGEIFYLEELAADCKIDGVYEFFLAAQPLLIPGATASPINPIAIK